MELLLKERISSSLYLFYHNYLDGCISSLRYAWLLSYFIEIPAFSANSVDPDQTPRSAASDLGQHCLPMSILWDARYKYVKNSPF